MMSDSFGEHFSDDSGERSTGSKLVEQTMKSVERSADAPDAADGPAESPPSTTGISAPSGETPSVPETRTASSTQPAAPAPQPAASPASGPRRTVHSTAYCLTGQMASGRRVYTGAAAMNGVPLGVRYRVLSGPAAGRVFTIEDRIGSGSQFDIAYPGDCYSARQYGSRTISVERM